MRLFSYLNCLNSTFSLGKLEEEFERKFNSLPQYSPMTFDKKGTSVTKKKKTESSTGQEEASKGGKGKNHRIFTAEADRSLSSHPQLTLHPLYLLNGTAERLHNMAFPCSLFLCLFWYIRVISISEKDFIPQDC